MKVHSQINKTLLINAANLIWVMFVVTWYHGIFIASGVVAVLFLLQPYRKS